MSRERDGFDEMARMLMPATREFDDHDSTRAVADALRTLARDERRAGWIAGQESMRTRAHDATVAAEAQEKDRAGHLPGAAHMAVYCRVFIRELAILDTEQSE
jgi:hypothetical protein